MKIKYLKFLKLIVFLIIVASLGAIVDYTYREKIAIQVNRSNAMSHLANELFLIDAINAGHKKAAISVLIASTKANLMVLAQTQTLSLETASSLFPCSLVKKARQLHKVAILDLSPNDESESLILDYMKKNCPGLPKYSNMAELPEWEIKQ